MEVERLSFREERKEEVADSAIVRRMQRCVPGMGVRTGNGMFRRMSMMMKGLHHKIRHEYHQ